MKSDSIKFYLSKLLDLEEDYENGFINSERAVKESFALIRELNDKVNEIIRNLT